MLHLSEVERCKRFQASDIEESAQDSPERVERVVLLPDGCSELGFKKDR
jgi:hypothetical protein